MVDQNADDSNIDDRDELFGYLDDIEPHPYNYLPSDDNDDSLAFLTSDVLDLLSSGDFDLDDVRDSTSLENKNGFNEINVKSPGGGYRFGEVECEPSMFPGQTTREDAVRIDATSNNNTRNNNNDSLDALVDIEMDFGDDSFVIDSRQFHSVFDAIDDCEDRNEIENEIVEENDIERISEEEGGTEQNNAQSNEDGQLLQHPAVEDFPIDIDLETEELYKDLANMAIANNIASTNVFGDNSNHVIKNVDDNVDDNVKKLMNHTGSKDIISDIFANQTSDIKKSNVKKTTMEDLLLVPDLNFSNDMGLDGLPLFTACQPCTPADRDAIASNENEIIEELYKELTNMSLADDYPNLLIDDSKDSVKAIDARVENSILNGNKDLENFDDKKTTMKDLLLGPNLNFGDSTDFLSCQPCTPADGNEIIKKLDKELTKMSLAEDKMNANLLIDDNKDKVKATEETVENLMLNGNRSYKNSDNAANPISDGKKKETTMKDLLLSTNQDFGLYCQPCTPLDEDTNLGKDLGADQRNREEQIRDLRALYMASTVNRDDLPPLDHSDPLLDELEARCRDKDPRARQLQDQEAADYKKMRKTVEQWAEAFGITLDDYNDNKDGESNFSAGEDASRPGLGHNEMILGVTFSENGKYAATACQDATIGIWDVTTNRLLSSLKGHDINHGCLRVGWASRAWADDVLNRSESLANIVASAGSDGTVKLWTCRDKKGLDRDGRRAIDNDWKCEYTLDLADLLSTGLENQKEGKLGTISEEEGVDKDQNANDKKIRIDKPQIYSLQFIDDWEIFTKNLSVCSRHEDKSRQELMDDTLEKNSFLLTSCDEFIHLWEVERHAMDKQLKLEDQNIRIFQEKIKLKEVMSLHFGPMDQNSYGVTACSITGMGMKLPPPPSNNEEDKNKKIAFGGRRNPSNTIFVFDAAYCPGNGLLGVALADGSLRLVNARGSCISVIHLPGNQSHLTSFCWDKTGSRLATCVSSGHLITWSLDANSTTYNTVATCNAIFEGGHQHGCALFGSRFCGEDGNTLLSWGIDGKICMWSSKSQGNIYDPTAILREDDDYPIYAVEISPSEGNVIVGGGRGGGFIGVPLYFYSTPPLAQTDNNVNNVNNGQNDEGKEVDGS